MKGMLWLKPEVLDLQRTHCPCCHSLAGLSSRDTLSFLKPLLARALPALQLLQAQKWEYPPKHCTEARKHHLPQLPQTVAEAEGSEMLHSSWEKAALAPSQHLPELLLSSTQQPHFNPFRTSSPSIFLTQHLPHPAFTSPAFAHTGLGNETTRTLPKAPQGPGVLPC